MEKALTTEATSEDRKIKVIVEYMYHHDIIYELQIFKLEEDVTSLKQSLSEVGNISVCLLIIYCTCVCVCVCVIDCILCIT